MQVIHHDESNEATGDQYFGAKQAGPTMIMPRERMHDEKEDKEHQILWGQRLGWAWSMWCLAKA